MIFLGAISSAEIDPKILGEFGDIDILFVPIGGGDVLDVPAASKLAVKLEAKLVIPMHYDKTALGAFLKEIGAEGETATDKLTIKKKDVLEMEGQVKGSKSSLSKSGGGVGYICVNFYKTSIESQKRYAITTLLSLPVSLRWWSACFG